MAKQRWKLVTALLVGFADLLLINGVFIFSYWLRFKLQFLVLIPYPEAPLEEYLKALVYISATWLVLLRIFGLYDPNRSSSSIDDLYRVIKAVSLGTLLVVSLTFFYRGFSYSRMVCLYSWGLAIVLLSAVRIALRKFSFYRRRKGWETVPVLLLGSGSMARFVAQKISRAPLLGYRIVGYVGEGRDPELDRVTSYLGAPDQLALLDLSAVEEIIVTDEVPHFRLLELLSLAESRGLELKLVPPVHDLLIKYTDVRDLDGIPLVALDERPIALGKRLGKRGFDLALAILALLLLSPLMLVAALAIVVDSGRPVFFRQRRAGLDGSPFEMIKFRTMVPDAEQRLSRLIDVGRLPEPVFKISDDPRVTRVGRWLRRTSFDELPQLLNVLRGEMSLVGPRPEQESLVQSYNVWQRRRLKTKPGITGLQQVVCRASPSLEERLRYDIYYIRKQSLLLDLWILVRTLGVVLSGKGAV